jgi:hypothetical protein
MFLQEKQKSKIYSLQTKSIDNEKSKLFAFLSGLHNESSSISTPSTSWSSPGYATTTHELASSTSNWSLWRTTSLWWFHTSSTSFPISATGLFWGIWGNFLIWNPSISSFAVNLSFNFVVIWEFIFLGIRVFYLFV